MVKKECIILTTFLFSITKDYDVSTQARLSPTFRELQTLTMVGFLKTSSKKTDKVEVLFPNHKKRKKYKKYTQHNNTTYFFTYHTSSVKKYAFIFISRYVICYIVKEKHLPCQWYPMKNILCKLQDNITDHLILIYGSLITIYLVILKKIR